MVILQQFPVYILLAPSSWLLPTKLWAGNHSSAIKLVHILINSCGSTRSQLPLSVQYSTKFYVYSWDASNSAPTARYYTKWRRMAWTGCRVSSIQTYGLSDRTRFCYIGLQFSQQFRENSPDLMSRVSMFIKCPRGVRRCELAKSCME